MSQTPVHLDTSFLIRALRPGTRQDQMLRALLEASRELAMSSIAWAEFLCGPLNGRQLDIARRITPELIPFGRLQTPARSVGRVATPGRRKARSRSAKANGRQGRRGRGHGPLRLTCASDRFGLDPHRESQRQRAHRCKQPGWSHRRRPPATRAAATIMVDAADREEEVMPHEPKSPDSPDLTFICGLGWPKTERYYMSRRYPGCWDFWVLAPGEDKARQLFARLDEASSVRATHRPRGSERYRRGPRWRRSVTRNRASPGCLRLCGNRACDRGPCRWP